MNTILSLAGEIGPALLQIKNTIHKHPELSFEEYKTSLLVRGELEETGLELIDTGLPTAVVGLLRGKMPGKTVALRADLDAIPLQEPGGDPRASENDGVMHACGHDFHTAALIGAVKILSRMQEKMAGNIVFLFQPAEETTSGARALLDKGFVEKLPVTIDAFFGLHNRPELPAGQVGLKTRGLMARKSGFVLTLHGLSGHGGMPHKCVDVITAAASIINTIQTIVSRNLDPLEPAVCSICSIHGGDEENFITDEVRMTGEIRTLSDKAHELVCRRLREITVSEADAFGCRVDVEISDKVPLLYNDENLYQMALESVKAVNLEPVTPQPCLASEDFACYAEIAPVFFYWLGTGFPDRENAEWHSQTFQTNDKALAPAAALLARTALAFIGD